MIAQPHRWDIGFIRRFMLVFGPLSSVFDYLTFGSLLLPRLIALPYSPLAALFGFVPLPLSYLVIVFVIVVLYVLSAEFTKRIFYRLDQSMVRKLPGQ